MSAGFNSGNQARSEKRLFQSGLPLILMQTYRFFPIYPLGAQW